jgi:hypothetical protein
MSLLRYLALLNTLDALVSELKAQETELAILKAEWESIVSRSAMISTTSANSRTSNNRPGDELLPSSEVPGAATATAALEGGKKLLGQLMGSIHLGTSGTSSDSQDMLSPKDPVNAAVIANNVHGRRSASKTISDHSQLNRDDGRRAGPTRGFSEQSGRNGRRTSFASDTASEEASRSIPSSMTRPRPQDEALGGLGFGQVLEGMVDPGEWTRRWGEVMSNPQYVDRLRQGRTVSDTLKFTQSAGWIKKSEHIPVRISVSAGP